MNSPFRPICFVVMPFGVKETGNAAPLPLTVDFDALWTRAIAPALEALGYKAVRADQDTGPLIVKEMLERLYYSDLIVADVSIANANAYYEVGIRHAARENGCVLIAADWAKPVFDLAQIRRVSYPNPMGRLDEAGAAPIREVLTRTLPDFARARAPMAELIAGYPKAELDAARSRELAGELEDFERLRAETAVVRLLPSADREARADAIVARFPAAGVMRAPIAIEIVRLLRDGLKNWQKALDYIEALPEPIRALPILQEQAALARSKQGDHAQAIQALTALIKLNGDSSERQGMLGGRYKSMYNESVEQNRPERRWLLAAITHYEQGMRLDLNDYYPSCNLPALYRERANPGDEKRAIAAATVARMACERSLARDPDDMWSRKTLLGLEFSERNLAAAEELADRVEAEGAVAWQLASTLDDLRRHVAQTREPSTQARLQAIVDRLARMV